MQYVSSTPATRLDVINLQEKLDQQLQQRQVRSLTPHGVSRMAPHAYSPSHAHAAYHVLLPSPAHAGLLHPTSRVLKTTNVFYTGA